MVLYRPMGLVRTRKWAQSAVSSRMCRQMAQWLSRPMLLDISNCVLESPKLSFDAAGDGTPSPFANTYQQYRLVHTLFIKFGRLDLPIGPSRIADIHRTIECWANKLPLEMQVSDAPSQWDIECPWLPIQRAYLHSFAGMVAFTPLKRYLLPSTQPDDDHHRQARDLASQAGINCLEAALRLCERIELPQSRYHFVTFALADTTTMICSALLHDTNLYLPRRADLFQAAESADRALRKLAIANPSASTASRLVQYLLGRVRLVTDEFKTSQDSKDSGSNGGKSESSSDALWTPKLHAEEAAELNTYEESLGTALPSFDTLMDPRYTFEELLGISLEEKI